MSLVSQFESMVMRVAERFGLVEASIGDLGDLTTTEKASLVGAVNEIKGTASGYVFVHTQASAASSWLINHNLGFRPDVSITNTVGEEVRADVLHLTVNQCQIDFVTPTAGVARFS